MKETMGIKHFTFIFSFVIQNTVYVNKRNLLILKHGDEDICLQWKISSRSLIMRLWK